MDLTIIIIFIIIIIVGVIIYLIYTGQADNIPILSSIVNMFKSTSGFLTQVPMDASMGVIDTAEQIENMALADYKINSERGLQKLHEQQNTTLKAMEQKIVESKAGITETYKAQTDLLDKEYNTKVIQLNDKYSLDSKILGEKMKLENDQLIRRFTRANYVRGLPYPAPFNQDQNAEYELFKANGKKAWEALKNEYDASFAMLTKNFKDKYDALRQNIKNINEVNVKKGENIISNNIGTTQSSIVANIANKVQSFCSKTVQRFMPIATVNNPYHL